jgi:hypothetical protein
MRTDAREGDQREKRAPGGTDALTGAGLASAESVIQGASPFGAQLLSCSSPGFPEEGPVALAPDRRDYRRELESGLQHRLE